jgi:hypothetical protein
MKVESKARKLLVKLAEKWGFLRLWVRAGRGEAGPPGPGAAIESLTPEERAILQELTSDDINDTMIFHPMGGAPAPMHLQCHWCTYKWIQWEVGEVCPRCGYRQPPWPG